MTKREFYISWIRAFVVDIRDLDELESIYDRVKLIWVKECMEEVA